MNHRRTSSDGTNGRLLPNYNLPDIDGEDDGMDMSPLKRLQRLKQNGSLRLVPKGRCSKRTLNFPPDGQNYSGSDTSLSDRDGKVPSTNSSHSDVSVGNCTDLERQAKSYVKGPNGKDVRDNKIVRFKDDMEDKNGNNSNSSETQLKDANGNLSTKMPPEENTQTAETSELDEKRLDVPSIVETLTKNETEATNKEESNDIDSETGEVKLSNSEKGELSQMECLCTKRVKPPVPAKPPNLSRLKTKRPNVQQPNVQQSESDNSSLSQVSDKPKPVTMISAQSNNGDGNHKKDKQNIVTVQYSPIAKPIIEVKLIQRQTRSQTPSPLSLRHSTNKEDNVVIRTRNRSQSNPQDDKWLSRSVDELDKPADVYACPTSFLRDTDVKLRHSFIDKGFTEKERQAIYNSVGDVQTLLRNSFVCEDEKIYSLPQPACYGDNTLKAVKKITEKYDTLQRRKLRALSFREGAKYSGPGASFSQPSSPVSPTGLSGVQPPPPPSSPPPPLSAGASSVCSVFDSPDGHSTPIGPRSPIPPPPPPRSTPSPSEEIPASSTGVTLKDTARLDLFYRGRGTEVVVCQCLADLRFGTALHSGSEEVSDWTPVINIGVPLLILNTGKGKRRRDLLVTIAERETGFPLWSDKINYLSNYRQSDPTSHVMQLSNNLKKVAGLTFHCETAAKEFLDRFQEITKDPNDDLWKVSSGSSPHYLKKKKRPFNFRRLKLKKASKNDISLPCNFSHITSVDPQDRALYEDLQNVPKLSRSLPSSPTSSRPSSIANSW